MTNPNASGGAGSQGDENPTSLPSDVLQDLQEISKLVEAIKKAVEQPKVLGDIVDGADYVYPYRRLPENFRGFEQNLTFGSQGADVLYLEVFLNEVGCSVPTRSSGYEGMVYDKFTSQAVTCFQEKYWEEVLGPWGLNQGTGFFGTTSRAKANSLLQEARAKRDEANRPLPKQETSVTIFQLDPPSPFDRAVGFAGSIAPWLFGPNDPDQGGINERRAGEVVHRIIQRDYVTRHPGAGFEIDLGDGQQSRPDLVSKIIATPLSPGELWEIKPVSRKADPVDALQQLDGYIKRAGGRYVPGTSYGIRIIQLLGTSNELVVEQGQPGILYYHLRPSQRSEAVPLPVPSSETDPAKNPNLNKGLLLVGTGAGGAMVVWWVAKALAPLCGPAAPICVVVF